MRRQTIRWQVGHLRDAEPIFREYLHGIGEDLLQMLPRRNAQEQLDILAVIAELHEDTGDELAGLLGDTRFEPRAATLESLRWSTAPAASRLLCDIARNSIDGRDGKPAWWKRKTNDGTVSTPELVAALTALRGHPGEEAEAVLREFGRHPQPALRVAALRSLGWWEPIDRAEVLQLTRVAKIDSNSEVRTAAVSVLARLGECAALNLLREAMNGPNSENVHQVIDTIANEGLTWLWPDLDVLTEADNPAIAHHAWEAVENLRESILGPLA